MPTSKLQWARRVALQEQKRFVEGGRVHQKKHFAVGAGMYNVMNAVREVPVLTKRNDEVSSISDGLEFVAGDDQSLSRKEK